MDFMAKVDKMEKFILERVGTEEFFEALTRALSYDVKNEMYEYIMREYDLKEEYNNDVD